MVMQSLAFALLFSFFCYLYLTGMNVANGAKIGGALLLLYGVRKLVSKSDAKDSTRPNNGESCLPWPHIAFHNTNGSRVKLNAKLLMTNNV